METKWDVPVGILHDWRAAQDLLQNVECPRATRVPLLCVTALLSEICKTSCSLRKWINKPSEKLEKSNKSSQFCRFLRRSRSLIICLLSSLTMNTPTPNCRPRKSDSVLKNSSLDFLTNRLLYLRRHSTISKWPKFSS